MRAFLIAAFAVLALAACDEKKKDTPKPEGTKPAEVKANETKPADDVILIGEVGSVTGPQAAFGISTRNGVELAVEEANGAGGVKGKKLAVRLYDDQSKPEEAAGATTRLINQDHVAVIIGEVASSNSLAMAPLAQGAQVPMITPSSTNPKVTEIGDYIFRVCFIDPFQGYVMAKYAKEDLKLSNVAILKDVKSAYSEGLADVFSRKFTELGGKIVGTEAFAQGDSDFRAQLTALKKLKPDGLYVPAYYNDVGVIARQAKELGLKSVMMGGDGWDSDKVFELGGSAVDGAYFSDHYSPEDPSPTVQNFITRYKAKYQIVPDSMAALGYDAARVAIEAMKRAPDLKGPALRDEIAKTKDFPGVAGTITMNEKRDAVKPAVVLTIKDGKFAYVSTVKPE
ncbi:MAG: ABC transporter substrate-binding protein [Myxococcaceae bacterium]